MKAFGHAGILSAMFLQLRVGVFITNNPGYAGRTELPGNLKSLFRPISMVQPDFTLICEVLLFSSGFLTANSLAAKVVQVFSAAEALVSQQTHYDWGLRAMKTILVTAGESNCIKPGSADDLCQQHSMIW